MGMCISKRKDEPERTQKKRSCQMKFASIPIRYKLKIWKEFILSIVSFLFIKDEHRKYKLKKEIKKYKMILFGLE